MEQSALHKKAISHQICCKYGAVLQRKNSGFKVGKKKKEQGQGSKGNECQAFGSHLGDQSTGNRSEIGKLFN